MTNSCRHPSITRGAKFATCCDCGETLHLLPVSDEEEKAVLALRARRAANHPSPGTVMGSMRFDGVANPPVPCCDDDE